MQRVAKSLNVMQRVVISQVNFGPLVGDWYTLIEQSRILKSSVVCYSNRAVMQRYWSDEFLINFEEF